MNLRQQVAAVRMAGSGTLPQVLTIDASFWHHEFCRTERPEAETAPHHEV